MLRICRAPLAYHKYISDIPSSGIFGESPVGRRRSPLRCDRLVIYYAIEQLCENEADTETTRWNYRQVQ
jgi:hypothetical protein